MEGGTEPVGQCPLPSGPLLPVPLQVTAPREAVLTVPAGAGPSVSPPLLAEWSLPFSSPAHRLPLCKPVSPAQSNGHVTVAFSLSTVPLLHELQPSQMETFPEKAKPCHQSSVSFLCAFSFLQPDAKALCLLPISSHPIT